MRRPPTAEPRLVSVLKNVMKVPSTLPHTNARVLIIDDDAPCVRGLLSLLKKEGYPLTLGMTDPTKALAELPDIQPSLILLDWHMDVMGGWQVLEILHKELPPALVPPVIVLTADSCPMVRKSALEAGASDFLTKPIDATEALLRIRNLLNLRNLHEHVQSENRRLEEIVQIRTDKLQQTIAELKELQQQVISEERMRAFTTMAGGVAHDFNNTLTIIRGYSELYSLRPELEADPEETRKAFEVIALAAKDAGEIVRRLGTFCRPFRSEEEERTLVDLNQLITEAIDLSRPKWMTQCQAKGIHVELKTELQNVPKITASAAELREIIINLIFNAVDAMPQGGSIILRTRTEGENVVLETQDTGTGMTAETRRRCLEPFYTTKGERGTGLGLAIIYGIVQRHHGTIRIHSELNHGTCISIFLPRASEAPPSESTQLDAPKVAPLRILLVDDDPSVCSVIRRFLETDDHAVEVALNGCEALEKFSGGQFDVVITDRVMPKMSGEQLATAIHEISPTARIVLLTGFEPGRKPAGIDCSISKPVTIDALRTALFETLSNTPSPSQDVRL